MFLLVSAIILTIIVLAILVIIKTTNKGIFLYDSYFIGIAIYTIGAFLLCSISMQDSELLLLEISIINFIAVFFIWAIARNVSNSGLKIFSLSSLESKNKTFANFSTVFLLLINLAFVYLVYTRIVQGHFAGAFALLDIRKTISSGEAGYFAPGLIKQIRDIYAPAFIVWLTLCFNSPNRYKYVFVVFAVILFSMVMGGQRMPILVLFISTALGFYFKYKSIGKSISSKYIVIFFVALLFILFGINLLLGRTNEDSGLLESFIDLILNITTRIFTTVPGENVHLIDYLQNIDLDPFSLWLSDLSILLPGTQEGFSNQFHSLLGGSKQGNAVLGAPLDIYVNAGYGGLVIVPALAFIFLSFLQRMIISKPNPFSVSIFIVVFCYMPFNYSFYLFLLNGGLLIVFYALYNLLIIRKQNHKHEC